MNRLIENGTLNTSLDGNGMNILNVTEMLPVPGNLVPFDSVLLDGGRVPINGSVTDIKVANDAAISQSKLNLFAGIPATWLGTHSDEAAEGDLAQLSSGKGVAGGYAAVDANGQLLLANLPSTGPQAGTVTDVKMSMTREFDAIVDHISEGAGTFEFDWVDVPDKSWFGSNGVSPGYGDEGVPRFITEQIPDSIMPDLDASKFVSGVFPVLMLPIMKGLGGGHAKGLVPDPGMDGNPSDYLARDGTYKHIAQQADYQPFLPVPLITLLSYYLGQARINLSCEQKGSRVFYLVQNAAVPPTPATFIEAPTNPITILVLPGYMVSAYAARPGYNNSPINTFLVPLPPEATTV